MRRGRGAADEAARGDRPARVLRLSYREVAAALGTTGTAVESAIFKSRRSLQQRLRPMRDAAGSLALPLSLQDSLSQLIPGFSQTAAGGGGVALIAKLSVPFGVKALVAGLSVVAVGGTLAVGHAPTRHHVRRAVAPPPLHVRQTPRPAPTAAPAVHVAPRITHVARTVFVAARTAAPKPVVRIVHHAAATTQQRSTDEQQQQQPKETEPKDGESSSDSAEHQSPGLTSRHSSDNSDSSDAQRQQADDARDAAEHTADAARDAQTD